MRAIDAYRDLQRELDKHVSPVFSIREFNYFYNKAISLWVKNNYKLFDIVQKERDDLKHFIKTDVPVSYTGASGFNAILPADYRHMLNVKASVRFKKDIGKYKANQTYWFDCKRLKSAQKGYRSTNAFQKASFRKLYYEITGDLIRIIVDETYHEKPSPEGLLIEYICEPDSQIYLNPDKTSDYSLEANNSTLFFNSGNVRNYIYYEILDTCKEIILENFMSPRYAETFRRNVLQS